MYQKNGRNLSRLIEDVMMENDEDALRRDDEHRASALVFNEEYQRKQTQLRGGRMGQQE